jgi:competence protein ComEC
MKRKDLVFSFLGFLVFLNILAWTVVFDLSQPQFLEVVFFDIGQGDAIFIQTPKKHQILIDGGPASVVLEKLDKEMLFWDRSIDLIILTHPESDHLSGLLEVLKRYKIENILWTGVIRDTSEYQEWLRLIKEEKAKIFIAQPGQKIILPPSDNNFIAILSPFENLEGKELKDSNNTSLVAKLIFGKNSFLFTGDIYKSGEKELIREYSCANSCRFAKLDSDVLKIAHHGSKSSTSEEFLKEVSPEIAVIPVGKGNRYGCPHQAVLDILEKYDIKVLRTDFDGDIKIISDGKEMKLRSLAPF